ncbi:membrane protein [Shewanella morhuae]|nr:membrane protein [Shewanella morhuae]
MQASSMHNSNRSVRLYRSFTDFYPFYLSQHQNPICRQLHFAGSGIVLLLVAITIFTQTWWLCWFVPLVGYGFAWIGHFVFERNRPATFQYPFYSLMADWVMFAQMIWHFLGRKNDVK